MIRMAISGTGAIAERAHIPALQSVAGIEIVALQSRTAEKAQRVAARLWRSGVTPPAIYTDFAQMLRRERPDAVGIFTPNYLHCDYALQAFACGAHVLCEKPMAPTAPAAQRMVDAATRASRVLMIAMQRRYGGFEAAVQRALRTGAIGTPNFIRARLSHGGPEGWAPGQGWFVDPKQAGGGAALDLGVHVVDLALWYLGEIASVSGCTATISKPIDVDDTAVMLLRFRSGALGVIEASWASQPGLSGLEIYASAGRVIMGYPRNELSVVRADGTAVPGYSGEELAALFDARDPLAPFRALAQNFADAIDGRAVPTPNGLDGLRAVEVIDACYRSSRSGRHIDLLLEGT
jgi:UDP-N-acetylglucosamine 3-dehydrogenase